MDLSAIRIHGPKAFFALLALAVAPSTMQATNLLTAVAPIAVTCNTATGPGASINFTLKAIASPTANAPLAITFTAPTNGLTLTAPVATNLTSATNAIGLVYSVGVGAGCVGASTGPQTIQIKQNGTNDITITVNVTVTAATSGLSAQGTTVVCSKSGTLVSPIYTPSPAQTISVTSAASGGTPFTIDTTTSPAAAWLTVGRASAGSATTTASTFTVQAAAGCNNLAAGASSTTQIHLINAPAPDKLITVTLQVVPPTPLTATPNPASLSYVKLSGNNGKVDVGVTSTVAGAFFAVDTSTLPSWLTVDSTTGLAPKSLRFSNTGVADSLAPGTYSGTVKLKVSGYADAAVTISLLVTNSAPKLTLSEGTTRNINWTIGNPLPTPFITAVSSDSPIAYAVTTGGTLAPTVSTAQQKGLAYNFGTQIPVSFSPIIFAAAQPGNVLTGVVTITWGLPASTVVVTFNVTVVSPGATLTSIAPASLPTAAAGQTFTVVISGTGFVPSADPTQKTKIGVVVSGSIVTDTNIASTVVNSSNITLTITVPAVVDQYLPFAIAGAGGNVTLGVCNPVNGACTTPTGQAVLTIGSNPIIQAITSSAAFTQVTAPTVQTVAPYDILSIFGTNFCPVCSSSQILYSTPDPASLRYPTSVSPDAVSSTQRNLYVTFQPHVGANPSNTVQAPLLFATNNQINLLVPAAMSAYIGSSIDVIVNFGYGTGATLKSSALSTLTLNATNPGIFTIGADGQGDAAALNSTWALVNGVNPAGMRSTAVDSDYIQLYVTGLGVPDSTGDNSTASGNGYPTWDADCVTVASFLASLNTLTGATPALTNLDGTVLQSAALNTKRLVPCMTTAGSITPTVSIGGRPGTVLYAGWVADTIAGLYQINVRLPGSAAGPFNLQGGAVTGSSLTVPVQLPVTITANGITSQAGVTLWVTPSLKVVAPTTLSGTVGTAWASSSNAVLATEGTSSYRYAITSGLLPAGLVIGSGGVMSGTPAANTAGTYLITVTATDSAPVPLTGNVSFTITIAGGLVVTPSVISTLTFATPNASVVTSVATGGVFPYLYAITTPGSLPTGMTINFSSGVIGINALTPAGTYHIVVNAIDSTAVTPLSGTAAFDVVVGLKMVKTSSVTGTSGTASTISTVTATGFSGTVSYALDTATLALGYVTINSSTGVVAITTGAPASLNISAIVTATDSAAPTNGTAAAIGSITVSIATS